MLPPMRAFRILLIVILAVAASGAARAQLQSFQQSSLVIDTAGGPQRFSIELALTTEQQEQGLMFRRSLAPDAGMLFIFPNDQVMTFWMKNTLIPLDMIFIAADGHVVDAYQRAVSMSETLDVSKVPARAVLEVNGGTVARLGIKPGDLVRYAGFGTATKN
jgi:hypothetical protein